MEGTFPFTLKRDFPFLVVAAEVPADVFAPPLTVITEVPDETVSGSLWRGCVEAHQVIGKAAAYGFCDLRLASADDAPRPGGVQAAARE